jgi:hypothetical protein
MKKLNAFIAIFCLLLVSSVSLMAQNTADQIAFDVVVPDQEEEFFTDMVKSRLETKVQQIAGNGITGSTLNPRFIVVPKVDLAGFETVAGAPPRVIAKLEVTLYVTDYQGKLGFGNASVFAKGVGRNDKEAYYKAINSIQTRSKTMQEFISDSKQKIVDYYESRCDQIIAEADRYIQMQEYLPAVSILMTVPTEAQNCYANTQERAIYAFRQHLEQECQQLLYQAKLASANRDFNTAIAYLGHVNASTNCAAETQNTINEISMEVDYEDRREWNLKLKMLDNQQELNRIQIEAMREIAIARYRSQMQSVNFLLIGR